MLTLAWGRGKWAFSQKRLMIQNLCILYILFTQNTCEYFFYDIVTLVHIIFITINLYYIVKRTSSNRVILTIALKNNIIHEKQFNHPISPKKKKYYSTGNCHTCTHYFYTIKLYCIVKRTTSNQVILTITLKIILFMENGSTILFPQTRKSIIQHSF